MLRKLLALMFLCLSGFVQAADMELEIIALKHRSAEELIPVIQPFIRPGASLTGHQYQLFIRTTPDNLAELRDMVLRLDTPPRRLLVTVRQNVDREQLNSEAELSGRANVGDNVRILSTQRGVGGAAVEHRSGGNLIRGRVESTSQREDSADSQQVQILEGQPATIQIGQSIPLVEGGVVPGYYGAGIVPTLQYHDVTRGFSVLARTHGDQVTLEVNPHRDILSPRGGGAIDTQSLHTTISGRLGEWLELGGVEQQETRQQGGIVYRTDSRESDLRSTFIKVEALD